MLKGNSRRSSLLMLITSMFIFGTIGIFRRSIPLTSSVIACFRGIVGSLFLLLYVKIRKIPVFSSVSLKGVLWLVISGTLIGLNWILLFEAYNYTTVSTATLCYYMEPIIVTLASTLLFKESLTLKKTICSVVALAGMVLVSGIVESGIPAEGELRGILLGLGAAVLYSCVVLMNRKETGMDSYERTIIQLASAAIVLIPYLAITVKVSEISVPPSALVMLFIVGIIHTGISYALYFSSMNGLQTQTIAIFSYIDPITALLLSAMILGEKMTIYGLLGAVLILGSAIISETDFGEKTSKS